MSAETTLARSLPKMSLREKLTPGWRLALLAALSLVLVCFFVFFNVGSAWEYIVNRRIMTVATMGVAAVGIGISTVAFQTISANRILTPSVMGFDALYVLIMTLFVYLLGSSVLFGQNRTIMFLSQTTVMVLFSLALYGWLLIGAGRPLHVLLLVGIILGVLFRSIVTFLYRLLDPNEYLILEDLSFASFTQTDEVSLWVAVCLLLVGGGIIYRRARYLDVMALGRDASISLGLPYRRIQLEVLVSVSLLVSAATALTGPTLFFGLLIAHLGYLAMGTNRHVYTLPAAALCGLISLVGGQLILEQLLDFATLLSVVINFAGGVLFITLLLRRSTL
ncbi:iron chelate uptake ABC transporter family permease subunit [Dermabacteraceae bacterium P13115]